MSTATTSPQFKPIIIDHTMLPDSDGLPVDNFAQPLQAQLLTDTLQSRLAELHPNNDYTIGRNSGIYWKLTDPPLDGCKAPDWFYVPGVPALLDGRFRRSFVLWREGVAPLVTMEFVSDDGATEHDTTPGTGKFWVYERAIRIPYYVIFDPDRELLEVYRLIDGLYRRQPPNQRGRYPIEPLGLELGLWRGRYENLSICWMRWFDPAGHMLPTGAERAEQEAERARQEAEHARQEAERAQQEADRARQAELRAEQLAAKLRKLGVDPDTHQDGV